MSIIARMRSRWGFYVWVVLLVAALSLQAFPQAKVFKWETELCMMTGTYDPAKYTEAQLRNTLMLFGPGQIGLGVGLQVWEFADIAKIDLAAWDKEYEQKSKKLRAMDIVKVPYFESLRRDLLKELEQVHRLTRTTAIAYTRPEVINDYPRAEACKAKYAAPLIAGGEDLVKVWREVNLASQKRNADPKSLQNRFDRENASPDRLKFALVETMNFGWWNCANDTIERAERAHDGTTEKEFRKLFRRVKEMCDEP